MNIEDLLKKHGETGHTVPGDIENYFRQVCDTHEYSYETAREIKDNDGIHYVIQFSGGNNGNSDWRNYLLVLADIIDHFQQDGYSSWCIQLCNDCLDDVHEVFMGLRLI